MTAIADPTAADTLLGLVQGAAMKSIVAEQATPADLKKYGFDKPQATLTPARGRDGDRRSSSVATPATPTCTCATVEAARRHRRPVAPRGSAEASRGISPEEPLRVQPLLHRSARVHARRADGRAREGQVAGSDARQVATCQSDRGRAGCDERGRSAHETGRPPGHLVSRLDGRNRPGQAVAHRVREVRERHQGGPRVVRAKPSRTCYAAIAGQPGAAQVSAAEFDEAIKALDLISK